MPGSFLADGTATSSADRCHSLSSLDLPLAALTLLPLCPSLQVVPAHAGILLLHPCTQYRPPCYKSGYTITQSLEIFTFQSIGVEIRENDRIDDVATVSFAVAICDGGSGKTTVTVTETNGRYKGNTAVWEISCEVELVGKQ